MPGLGDGVGAGNRLSFQYLDGPPHNHDGVMQGPLCLLHKLFSTTTEDDGTCLGLSAASEEIVPMSRMQWCTHELPPS